MNVIKRSELRAFLDRLTVNPTLIFSVECARRTHLELRYPPPDDFTEGDLAYVGDASTLDGQRIRICPHCGRHLAITSRGCGGPQGCGVKRATVILQPAGTLRIMVCKRKLTPTPMKHWAGPKWLIRHVFTNRPLTARDGAPKRGHFDSQDQARQWFISSGLPMDDYLIERARLRFNPERLGLYPVVGMYPDEVRDFGTGARLSRHGQWRSWAMIDLRTTRRIRYANTEYVVQG